jgi:hypothetical protein
MMQRQHKWDKDGYLGVDNGNNSLQIILDWWKQPGNYEDYWEQHKVHHHRILAQRMINAKVRAIWTEESVAAKIKLMEGEYWKAEDWAQGTGSGVLESRGKPLSIKNCYLIAPSTTKSMT